MSPIGSIVLAFVVVVGVTFIAGVAALRLWPGIRMERLREAPAVGPAGPESILRFEDQPQSLWHRLLHRVGSAVGPKQAERVSHYRTRLGWAGYHDPRAVALMWGAKLAMAILGALAYPALNVLLQRVRPPSDVLIGSLLLFAGGFFAPDFWLYNRVKARQRTILRAFPDVLDLLTVCVEAGLGFDAAVARVSEQPSAAGSPLHQEMYRMHLEIRAGRPRPEALRALGDRVGVDEIKAMVGAFVQSERLGTPLGKTLRIHADAARVQRRYRAEERAYVAPVKMIFPTVLFLMPAFVLIAMSPSLLAVVEILQKLAR